MLETPKALSTHLILLASAGNRNNESDNLKDITMDNQQETKL